MFIEKDVVTLQKIEKSCKIFSSERKPAFTTFQLLIMTKELTLKQRIITLFLTLVFILYVGNVSFFVHTHKVGDITIVHSHPFTSSSHNHSANTISTLSCLGHFYSLPAAETAVFKVFMRLLCVLDDCAVPSLHGEIVAQLTLRAPPIL